MAGANEPTGESSPLRALFRTLTDGVLVVDQDGRALYANDALARMVGSTPGNLVGQRFPSAERDVSALFALAGHTGDTGAGRDLEIEVSPLDWEGARAYAITVRDVEGHREAEARLTAAQRMGAVGQLAGGMAHEINNVLAVVLASVGLLRDRIDDEEALRLADEMDRSARRGAALLERLLAVGRRQRLRVGTVDMREVVEELGDTLRRVLPTGHRLEVTLPSDRTLARADATAVEQILLNLVNNACDALPDGGTIQLVVEATDVSKAEARHHPALAPGAYVRLTVRDQGVGMDAETLGRAFQPFFTTKPHGQGTGLGLSTVYGLTKQLGGFFYLSSEVGRGTAATLFFPVVPEAAEAATTGSSGPAPEPAGETILLVEDEEPLRRVTARVLGRTGYSVIEAASGLEALEILRERMPDIDLILTDVVMPGMGGPALYDTIRNWPERPPVLFVSGYAADDLHGEHLLDPAFDLLPKPWAIPELQAGVRRALAAGALGVDKLRGGRRY